MTNTTALRSRVRQPATDTTARADAPSQKAGGVAALYAALALLAAIPYFLLVVDYPGATTSADKVALIVDYYPSLYVMLLGGLWVLLVSMVALRAGVVPKALGWPGTAIGVIGLASVAPPLHEVSIAFGLLQIAWFGWLGVVLLTTTATAARR